MYMCKCTHPPIWGLTLRYVPSVDNEQWVVVIKYVSGQAGAVYVLRYQILKLHNKIMR